MVIEEAIQLEDLLEEFERWLKKTKVSRVMKVLLDNETGFVGR
jgi:hypothetical protein